MKVSDYVLSHTKMLLRSEVMVLLLITLSVSPSISKTFEYRLTQANNIQRQELLQRKCDKYDLGNNELYQNESIHTLSEADLEHLLIDRKHKFLYCYVPKVSWVLFIDRGSFSRAINFPFHGFLSFHHQHNSPILWRDNLQVSWKCQVDILFSFR